MTFLIRLYFDARCTTLNFDKNTIRIFFRRICPFVASKLTAVDDLRVASKSTLLVAYSACPILPSRVQ